MIGMIRNVLISDKCNNGIILDGFPRTVEQATALQTMLNELTIALRKVLYIEVTEEHIMERLLKRAEVEHRADDTPETITKRIDVYKKNTAPVKDYYTKLGLLSSISGEGTVEEVSKRMVEALK